MESNKKIDIVPISVIIPIYNRNIFLDECIKSVTSQSLPSVEVIIVDDGSEIEKSNALCEMVKGKENIRLVRQAHNGAWAARNAGIKQARGEYVSFLDSDDYYADRKVLEELYVSAKKNNALICGGNIINVFEDGRQEYRGYVFRMNGFCEFGRVPQLYGHTRYIYCRDFLINNNIEYYPLKRFEDPPFVINAMLTAQKYYGMSRNIYCCRQYKRKRTYDYETLCDIAEGIYQCYLLCKKIDKNVINKLGIENALNSIMAEAMYYHVLGNNRFDEILNKLNIIQLNAIGHGISFFEDMNNTSKWVETSMLALKKIKEEKKMVIYGAGYVAKLLLNSDIVSKDKIECIAVSSNSDATSLENIPIVEIGEYSHSELLVVIAANGEKKYEMIKNLREINSHNYCCIDDKGIRLGQYFFEQYIDLNIL